MKRSLKRIALALMAIVTPCFAWAGQIYTNTLSGDDTSLTIGGVTYATTKFTASTDLSNRTATCTGAYGGIIVSGVHIATHSVAGWFKVDSGRTDKVVLWSAHTNNAGLGGYSVQVSTSGAVQMGRTNDLDGLEFESGNTVTTNDGEITDGKWYHIAMTYTYADGNNLTPLLYIDGEPVAFTDTEKTITCGLNGNPTCSHFRIGAGVTAGGLKMNNDAISAENIKNDVYAGSTGYLDSHSISFYVNSGSGTAYDTNAKYGWEGASIIASNWNAISNTVSTPKSSTGIELTNTTVYVNGKGGAWYAAAPAQLGSASRGYYDGQWNLTLEGLPYTNYKVVLFMATDNTGKVWGPVKVTSGDTETYYAYDADKNLISGDGVTATTTWGTTGTANGGEGVDVMVIPNLSGTVNLLTHGTSHGDALRGGLFAMQIINTGAIIESREYTATITEDVTFDEIVWAEEGFENVANNSASVTIADGKTLTFDSVVELYSLKVATANASDTVTIKIDLTEEADVRTILNKLDLSDTNGVVKVSMVTYTGKAAWMAYEFNGDYANSGSEGSGLSWDGGGAFGNYSEDAMNNAHTDADENGNRALRLPARPWRDVSAYPAAFTAVMYAKAGTTPNGVLASFGSATGGQQNTVTLATGANPDKDEMRLVQCGNLQSVATDLVQNLAVPNSQKSNHLYAFAMYTKNGKTRAEVYVDGELLTTYTFDSVITLGTGLQVGSIHGGAGASGLTALNTTLDETTGLPVDPATMDFIRVYDCLLSEEMLQTMAEAYPYTSPSGTATRELDGSAANWVEADESTAWSQATLNDDATTTTTDQNAPNDGTNIVLTATDATELTVNLPTGTPAYETLTITGDVTLVAGEGTEVLTVSGRTTINGDVTMPYNLVHLSTVTVKSGKTLTIDASSIDLSKIYTSDTIGLTGLIEKEDDTAKVEVTLPTTGAEGRKIEVIETEAGYSLKITFTGVLEATVPAAGATWAELTWTLGSTEITAENLPESFATVPVILTAEEGATLTLTEDLTVGPLTIQGADLNLAGEFTLAASALTTETAIVVDEKTTLDLSATAVAAHTQNIKGTGLVKIALTNDYANTVTLTGFEGTTYVTKGYFSVDTAVVGSLLRLADGTQVQTTKTTEDASLNITLDGNVQFYANSNKHYTTTGTISGGTLNKQGAGTLTAAGITSTLAINVGEVAINPGDGKSATLEGRISGSASLKIASGTVITVEANGNYGGAITVAEGATLKTTGGNHVPFGTGVITNDGTIDISPSDKSVIGGVISGSGDIIVNSGTLELNGANTYTGTTTVVADAALTLSEGASIGAGDLVLNGALTGSATIASGKTISGTGTVNGALALADGATITACTVNVTGDITAAGETVAVVLPEGAKAGDAVIDCDNAETLVEKLTVEGFNLTVDGTTIKLAKITIPDSMEGLTDDFSDAAKAALLAAAIEANTSIESVVAGGDQTAATIDAALALFDGIVTVDGTTATVDWDFGISDIKVNRDTNGSLMGNVDIMATVKNKKGDDNAGYATGVTVILVDAADEEVIIASAGSLKDGVATFKEVSISNLQGKKIKAKATNKK